jgi:hypothetical protein
MYALDPVVRRAPALQKTRQALDAAPAQERERAVGT